MGHHFVSEVSVSLEGSLQTVALPEVLHLLADNAKSGELRVSGSRAVGRLWFEAGELSGFQSGRCKQAIDALFDLLRMENGEFTFESDVFRPEEARRPSEDVRSVDIRPLIEQGEARLVEWVDIVAVVPSLAHRVELVTEAPEGGVVLDGSQWSMVVTIGEGRSVQQVLDSLDLPEFDGCKALKGLADERIVQMVAQEVVAPEDDLVPAAHFPAERAESDDALNGLGVWSSEELASLDGPEEPMATAEDAGDDAGEETPSEEGAEPINRGLLLKFLSSVRS
jgi:hypothetical protein